ncbi:MAG: T9SS type A sorting domain-containing protein [Bacteroidia bacterium]|nr:T9SS type A sorting domain-containing protein [Bacteroidia bacterium]
MEKIPFFGRRMLLWLMMLSGQAWATTVYVTSLQDSGTGSLRQAIQTVGTGDTIRFLVTGTIPLQNTLTITVPLTIIGPGAGQLRLDGQNAVRILHLNDRISLQLSGLTFFRGNAAADINVPGGGAIRNEGDLYLTACVFTQNRATYGGAIENQGFEGDTARTWLDRCAFYQNYATTASDRGIPLAGGALYGDARRGGVARFEAVNCTFYENSATYSGGAIFLIGDPAGGASLTLAHTTIATNAADFCGGVDLTQAEALRAHHTLIYDNPGSFPNLGGAVLSQGHNLIGPVNAIVNYVPASTDITGADPLLGDPADTGDGLPVLPLGCGSPALEAGDPTAAVPADQRGMPRQGLPDIGAFELNAPADLVVTQLGDAGWGSLRQVVALSCAGDTVTVAPLTGTIRLRTPLTFTRDITVIGNDQAPVILSGGNLIRLLEVVSGIEVSISWFTLRQGNPGLYGGGAVRNKGTLSLAYCTLSDNQADAGGAIGNYGDEDTAYLYLVHCTLARNTARLLDGGALDNRGYQHGAHASLVFCTVSENTAEGNGGGIANDADGTVSLQNTLVADNTALAGGDLGGSIQSAGHNLVADLTGSIWTSSAGDLTGLDPLLDPLDNYGGPTFTCRLSAESPAIDAGTALAGQMLDQRGEARLYGSAPDIGAYEYDPATSLTTAHIRLVTVFPNPATEQLWVICTACDGQPVQLSLTDMTGRLVLAAQQTGPDMQVQLPQLPEGMYVMTAETPAGRQSLPVMIRQR